MAANTFQRFTIDAKAALEVLVMPHFGDVVGENGTVIIPSDEQDDWQIMPDVPYSLPVIDITANKNVLKRRDATCKLISSSLGKTSNRMIKTEKVYIKAENCQQELYQGAFRDWESRQDVFSSMATEIISKVVGADLFSNKWFGWTSRPHNVDYSLNVFDGIWHWVAADVATGTIPAGQTVDLGDASSFTDAEAYAGALAMIDQQGDIMKNLDDDMKALHIDKNWYTQIIRYLKSIGDGTPADKAGNLAPLIIEGIKVKPKKWNPIIYSIMGAAAHLGILTIDGNFIYATDSKYGKGPHNAGPALVTWYSEDDDLTYWEFHHKGGTMLATPGYATVGTSTGVLAQL